MLRTIRELQRLSQTELAALTGIAQSNLSALRVHPAVLLFPDFDVSEVA